MRLLWFKFMLSSEEINSNAGFPFVKNGSMEMPTRRIEMPDCPWHAIPVIQHLPLFAVPLSSRLLAIAMMQTLKSSLP